MSTADPGDYMVTESCPQQVESFRNQAGLPNDIDPEDLGATLGPQPDDPRLAAIRSGLAQELRAIADVAPSISVAQS